jgi:outer membrane protein assembly factor BamB/predicted phosphodiesterase
MNRSFGPTSPIEGRVLVEGGAGAAVTVSDGLNITLTAPDGSFTLPGFGPFAFMTIPTGFSADRWYLPADHPSVEFRLVSQDQPTPFTFVQVTDLHLSLGSRAFGKNAGDATLWFEDGELRERIVATPVVLEAFFEEIARRHPNASFIVSTGDQTNSGTENEFVHYLECVSGAEIPVRSIPGNHDHNQVDPQGPPAPTPYERHLGPRWFSFDFSGVHFAAIDWTTHYLGLDGEIQERWLLADLAMLEPDTPVILLTHDQMLSDFYQRLSLHPIASFSGHWHTSRVVEALGTRHYNSGSALFGGLDYSPAHYRVVTWDGGALHVTTMARGPEELAGSTFRPGSAVRRRGEFRWVAELSGAVQRAAPIIDDSVAIAASGLEDTAGGFLEAFELETGRRVWSNEFSSAVKASPVASEGSVVASAVTGETVCADASDGTVLWRTQIDEPLRLWTYLRPLVSQQRVFVGDVGRFTCLDLGNGSVVWSRDDLGRRENLTSASHPIIAGGSLILSFAAQVPDIWSLDPATGETRWPPDAKPESIYRLDQLDILQHLPRTPVSGFCADPDSDDFYVIRLGSQIERIAASTGEVVWSAPFMGWFNPAAPVVSGDHLLAAVGTGSLWCLDRSAGSLEWKTDLSHEAPVAMGPYRDAGGFVLSSPVVVGERILIALGDGRIDALSSEGKTENEFEVGVPIAASPAVTEDLVIVAAVDGVLRAIPIDRLLGG